MAIKFIINGMVTIKNLPPSVLVKIKEDLTIANPKYLSALKSKNSMLKHYIPETLELYIQRGSHTMIVPRGYMNRAISVINTKDYEIIDNTVTPTISKKFEFIKELRDYQEMAVANCTKRRYGILEAATGSGKTVMILATIVKRQTRTLILVHSTELLYQWQERIKEFLGYDCGLMGDGKFSLKDITVGIINTVYANMDKLATEFGYVAYDECHRAIGGMWLDVINTLMPKYHMGATATPFRSDGTTKALYAIIGPKFHIVDKKMLEESGAISIPKITRIHSKSYIAEDTKKYEYVDFISHIVGDTQRSIYIAQEVYKEYLYYKEPVLVVSDRVEHCEILAELLNAYQNLEVLVLHGKIKKSERKSKVEEFKKGKYNVLVATVSLIGEGFDSPSLGSVFLTTPIKFSGRLIQTIGRILRPHGTEKPRVYDIRDNLIEVFKYSGFARDRMYKANGWE